jgi:hypothetical protein
MRKLVVLGCLLLSTQATIAQEQGREVAGPRAVLEYRDRPPVENTTASPNGRDQSRHVARTQS